VREFEEKVDHLEHAYNFYLQSKWGLLDSVMGKRFEGMWPEESSVLERHTTLHRILQLLAASVEPEGVYFQAKCEIWSRIFKKEAEFAELAHGVISEPGFVATSRRVAEQLMTLLRDAAEWIPTLAISHLRAVNRSIPENWRVPLGRIDALRDAYRQNFEVGCQMLPLVIMLQNVAEGRDSRTIRDPSQSDGWAPRTLDARDLVNNINQYRKAKSATKEAYLNRHPVLRYYWNASFSRDVRNSIAHAEFDYVMHDGAIRYKGREVPYYVFVEALIKQISLLVFWLDFLKLHRVYGSRWDPVNKRFLGVA
jgi:hypothetical protein